MSSCNKSEYDFAKVSESINTVIQLALENKDEEVVKQMKRIVPEFISNNSIYESIDAKMFKPLYSAIR